MYFLSIHYRYEGAIIPLYLTNEIVEMFEVFVAFKLKMRRRSVQSPHSYY
jgi:hypothetical protein